MIKKLSIFLFIFIIGIAFIIPKSTNAQTIQQFEDEVAKYTAQLQAKKNAIAKNDQEVAEIEEKIKSIQSEIKTLQQEITNLQAEIDKANIEIEKKTAQSKKLIEYYQVSNGENSYLEYVFGATSITDMIYRMSVVEQLTEYNDNLMKELQNLIEQNKIRQTELDQKQKDLNAKQKELEEEQAKIEKDTAAIKESMPSVEQQIKSAQANVKYYKALGCGQNEDILQCQYRIEQARSSSSGGSSGGGSIPSTNGFYRPMEYGYVTQYYSGCGTYIRSICDDAGEMTGFHAHALSLRRTKAGPFDIKDAYTEEMISELSSKNDYSFVIPRETCLQQMPRVELTSSQFEDVKLGKKISSEGFGEAGEGERVAAFHRGALTAVIYKEGGIMRIERMLYT